LLDEAINSQKLIESDLDVAFSNRMVCRSRPRVILVAKFVVFVLGVAAGNVVSIFGREPKSACFLPKSDQSLR
jgi:hypothetical protein